jgi:hypothetical protein
LVTNTVFRNGTTLANPSASFVSPATGVGIIIGTASGNQVISNSVTLDKVVLNDGLQLQKQGGNTTTITLATSTGTVTASNFVGSFIGDGSAVTNLTTAVTNPTVIYVYTNGTAWGASGPLNTAGTTTAGIQEAINSLPTVIGVSNIGGGKIVLAPGIYTMSAGVTIPNTWPFALTMQGAGKQVTTILYTGPTNTGMFTCQSTATGLTNMLHLDVSGFTFSYERESTNFIFDLQNTAFIHVYNSAFIGYETLTNGHGQATLSFEQVTPTRPSGIVGIGLYFGNSPNSGQGTFWIHDNFFLGLATAFYNGGVRGIFANNHCGTIGTYWDGATLRTHTNMWNFPQANAASGITAGAVVVNDATGSTEIHGNLFAWCGPVVYWGADHGGQVSLFGNHYESCSVRAAVRSASHNIAAFESGLSGGANAVPPDSAVTNSTGKVQPSFTPLAQPIAGVVARTGSSASGVSIAGSIYGNGAYVTNVWGIGTSAIISGNGPAPIITVSSITDSNATVIFGPNPTAQTNRVLITGAEVSAANGIYSYIANTSPLEFTNGNNVHLVNTDNHLSEGWVWIITNSASGELFGEADADLVPGLWAQFPAESASVIVASYVTQRTAVIYVGQNPAASAPASNFVAGSIGNTFGAGVGSAAIGGGHANSHAGTGNYGVIGGGQQNTNKSGWSFIGGGQSNLVALTQGFQVIGGGAQNVIGPYGLSADPTFIGGGTLNVASNSSGVVIVGGTRNFVDKGSGVAAYNSAVLGGIDNTNTASYATVAGGRQNLAGADYAFAAGRRAQATNQGAFVLTDSQNADFPSTTTDQLALRFQNGVTNNGPLGISGNATVGGTLTTSGSGASSFANELDLLGATNYAAGNVRLVGGLYCPTNMTASFNFQKLMSWTNIGAAFTIPAPIGIDGAKTMGQQTLYSITNNTAAAVLVTGPANAHMYWWGTNVTGFYLTNFAQVWAFTYGGAITNLYVSPGF